jgi:hypothetical protein
VLLEGFDLLVVEGRAVVAGETVDLAEHRRGGEDIRGDDLIQQPLKLAIGERDAIERLEVLPEVLFQRGAVTDVVPQGVLQTFQLFDQRLFDLVFGHGVLSWNTGQLSKQQGAATFS